MLREVIAQFARKCLYDNIALKKFSVELFDFKPEDFVAWGLDNYSVHHVAFQ